MARPLAQFAIVVALLSIPLGYIYNAYGPVIRRSFTVAGVFRYPTPIARANSQDLVIIEGTTHCEDIHYHEPSHQLYTACEDSKKTRFSWFPPLGNFDVSTVRDSHGGLFVIDPDVSPKPRSAT
jgi:hypothetical protein